jgi:hypothetical protein
MMASGGKSQFNSDLLAYALRLFPSEKPRSLLDLQETRRKKLKYLTFISAKNVKTIENASESQCIIVLWEYTRKRIELKVLSQGLQILLTLIK